MTSIAFNQTIGGSGDNGQTGQANAALGDGLYTDAGATTLDSATTASLQNNTTSRGFDDNSD